MRIDMQSSDQERPDVSLGRIEAAPAGSSGHTRRRLITAASGGVLLSVTSTTALGNTLCQSPSAMMSGNASPRPNDGNCTGGLSPGFWAQPQKFPHWRTAGATPPMFNGVVVDCTSGKGKLKLADITAPGTLINDVFPGAVAIDYGMWAVIAFPNEELFGDKRQLLRHLSAAWLNAGYFEFYPLSRTQILNMWNDLRLGGTYCPTENCGSGGWTEQQVIAYIEGMYDFNADVPNLCKVNE